MVDYKISIIIGTRAELIKTFPLMLEFQKRNIPYYFIHTGQHSLKNLCEIFSVKRPDVVLTRAPKKSSKFDSKQVKAILWNLSLILKIRKELKKLKNLRYVFYHGDTMTTASASIASSELLNPFKKYKNVHLEAGLRSDDLFEPFPEEISRRVVGKFSDILFAVSNRSEKNLHKYKNIKKIIKIGNTIIDSADISYKIAEKEKIKPLSKEKFALISVHRHENIKNKERLKKIVKILMSLKIESYFTLHDNTKKQLIKFNLYERLKQNENIKIIETLEYVNFIYQVKNCSLIICDGGSLQEESLIFKKPCIILRKATERQEGLETNFQFLSKLNVKKTKEKINEFLDKKFKIKDFENPYGKLGISKKIVEILR
jgi:UDP-N-acetylglucosamine 2-epimerase|tara:strand:+ start:5487 stop:6602 length:1116 start_codon:yes stop_codon:yes gene_type:complete